MGTLYVARSAKFSEWASDVGLSKNVFKVGYTDEPGREAIEAGWGGADDWTIVGKKAVDGLDEAELIAKLARKEKLIDPTYYPRLKGATGIFKVVAGQGREQHPRRQIHGRRDHLQIAEAEADRLRRLSHPERAEIAALARPQCGLCQRASRRSKASALPSRPERISPTSSSPAMIAVPGAGIGPATRDRHELLFHQGAIFHPRGQLLADIAALVPVDAVECVEARIPSAALSPAPGRGCRPARRATAAAGRIRRSRLAESRARSRQKPCSRAENQPRAERAMARVDEGDAARERRRGAKLRRASPGPPSIVAERGADDEVCRPRQRHFGRGACRSSDVVSGRKSARPRRRAGRNRRDCQE